MCHRYVVSGEPMRSSSTDPGGGRSGSTRSLVSGGSPGGGYGFDLEALESCRLLHPHSDDVFRRHPPYLIVDPHLD